MDMIGCPPRSGLLAAPDRETPGLDAAYFREQHLRHFGADATETCTCNHRKNTGCMQYKLAVN